MTHNAATFLGILSGQQKRTTTAAPANATVPNAPTAPGPYLYRPGGPAPSPRRQPSQPAAATTTPERPKPTPPPTEPRFAWLAGAIAALPEDQRVRAGSIVLWAIGDQHKTEATPFISSVSSAPPTDATIWMRRLFSLTSPTRRRQLYRELAKMCHPDSGGSDALFSTLQSTYKRFSTQEVS